MKKIFSLCLLSATFAMPAMAQRIQQDLGRGVVAVNRNPERSVTSGTDGKLVSWRRLATESEDTQYNVYQNGSLLATTKNTNLKLSNLNNNDVFPEPFFPVNNKCWRLVVSNSIVIFDK